MEIKFAVLADAANLSRENKLNVTGIFNRIAAEEFPVTWPMMVLVVRVDAHASEHGKHALRIRVVDEDGEEIAKIEGGFRVPKATDSGKPVTTQFIIPIGNAAFPRPSTYAFDILIDGRYEGSMPLYVVQK